MSTQDAQPKPAVSAVIVENRGILLVRRGQGPNVGLWSLPGGKVEPGETVRDALEREVFEETALRVEVGDVAWVHDAIGREAGRVLFHYVIVSLYAAPSGGTLHAGSDAVEARWVPLDRVREYDTTAGLVEKLASAELLL